MRICLNLSSLSIKLDKSNDWKLKLQKFLILVCINLIFFSCSSSSTPKQNINNFSIAPKQALRLYDDSNYVFLDVRTRKEHNEKSIPNSILIPLHELDNRLKELEIVRNRNLIVYCRSGNRSKSATNILISHKFKAINLLNGINGWEGPTSYKNWKKGYFFYIINNLFVILGLWFSNTSTKRDICAHR